MITRNNSQIDEQILSSDKVICNNISNFSTCRED